ncbi:MAG: alkaline phosphatase family protein [Candidatus Dormibacteria bacterium]
MTAGFPATTAASVSSLGTGASPGGHGILGYTMRVPGYERAINALTWSLYGIGGRADLTDRVVPERFQPHETLFQRASRQGITVTQIGDPRHEHSGLTRAALRGGKFRPAQSPTAMSSAVLEALTERRSLIYAHHPDLDRAGHIYGVDSAPWWDQLVVANTMAKYLADHLPSRSLLLVTGDHGMVDLTEEQRIDIADHPELRAGVRMLAGEARARYVHTEPGAAADVLAAWGERLGDRMWVWSRDEAIATGAFGPISRPEIAQRIGDVVAAAFAPVGIVERAVDPAQARLVGHHGSFTPAEQLVPLLLFRSN